jgi:hypothetical protein
MVEQPYNMATTLLIDAIKQLQHSRDISYVRMVYEWRLHKHDGKLMDQLLARFLELGYAIDTMPYLIGLSDWSVVIPLLDSRVLVGGEYMYLHEGKQIAEAMAAEAIERNADKIRCNWCWNDAEYCTCSHDAQYEEMKYD